MDPENGEPTRRRAQRARPVHFTDLEACAFLPTFEVAHRGRKGRRQAMLGRASSRQGKPVCLSDDRGIQRALKPRRHSLRSLLKASNFDALRNHEPSAKLTLSSRSSSSLRLCRSTYPPAIQLLRQVLRKTHPSLNPGSRRPPRTLRPLTSSTLAPSGRDLLLRRQFGELECLANPPSCK